jgi:serine/threonine-protein kinase
MELLRGESLGDRMRRERLSHDLIVEIMGQLLVTLAAAHEQGIVHRDLKPDNLFLVSDALIKPSGLRVKVLDFGIAKLPAPDNPVRTKTSTVVGTPTYMSPEQCVDSKDVDHRSDIYALGVILFELATGGWRPFDCANSNQFLIAHVKDPPFRPTARDPSVPPPLEAIILRCLEKDPRHRYQSVRELHEDLLRWQRGDLPAPRPPATPPPGGTAPPTQPGSPAALAAARPTTLGASAGQAVAVRPATAGSRRRRLLIGGAAAAVLAAGLTVGIAAGLSKRDTTEPTPAGGAPARSPSPATTEATAAPLDPPAPTEPDAPTPSPPAPAATAASVDAGVPVVAPKPEEPKRAGSRRTVKRDRPGDDSPKAASPTTTHPSPDAEDDDIIRRRGAVPAPPNDDDIKRRPNDR